MSRLGPLRAGRRPAEADDAIAVVDFWRAAGHGRWFSKDPAFDRSFRERFLDLHRAVARRRNDAWLETPEGALALVLLTGTLNRVMIVELGVPAWLVALMVSLPLVFAPFRALLGFRSDVHRSVLGWRRVPYLWMGTLLQFGGFAIMPFALIILSGDTHGPVVIGQIGAALAFLLVGAGLHTTQTAGLALATDLAPAAARPRVVALLYVMLLVGMVLAGAVFGALLADFHPVKLIQVIQGSAVATIALNIVALWKQETRRPPRGAVRAADPTFAQSWRQASVRGFAVVGAFR